MRIACVYLPSFALQAHIRQAPYRAGRPFAVLHKGGVSGINRILVCSKAAWEMGLRPGMSATKSLRLAPAVEYIAAEPELYRRAFRALAESFLTLSLCVDIGDEASSDEATQLTTPHMAMYIQVPKHSRGDSFGNKILSQLDKQGYRARVGIADNRFTAWVAARSPHEKKSDELFADECRTISQGGNGAFLAPKSIDLLGLDDDVQHMLETLGIKTLGDFAELPPPTHGHRWVREGVDFRRLAQGEGPTFLHGFAPSGVLSEGMKFEEGITDVQALTFSLRPLSDRACDRLQGRGMAAAHMSLRLYSDEETFTELQLHSEEPSLDSPHLLKSLHQALVDYSLTHAVVAIELSIEDECSPAMEEATLLDSQGIRPSNDSIRTAIERIEHIRTGVAGNEEQQQRSFQLKGWAGAPMPAPIRPARYRSSVRRAKPPQPSMQVLLPL